MTERAQVAIIGAGVNGLAAARALTRRGTDVVVLERFALGHTNGSSHGPVRIFRTAYDDPAWVEHARAALAHWADLEGEAGTPLLRREVCVNVGPGLLRLARAMGGVGFDLLDGRQATRRFPALRFSSGEDVLVEAEAAVIDAATTMRALADSARAHGARICEGRRVLAVTEGARAAKIATEDGAIEADVVVVAAGAWARDLVGDRLPQARPAAQTVLYAPVTSQVPILIERTDPVGYALPLVDGTVRAGLSRGDAGGHPDDPNAPDDVVAGETLAWLRGRLAIDVGEPTLMQRCMYTMTPDESFVLRRDGRIVTASACSGHAFKFAPLTGEQIADLALGTGG